MKKLFNLSGVVLLLLLSNSLYSQEIRKNIKDSLSVRLKNEVLYLETNNVPSKIIFPELSELFVKKTSRVVCYVVFDGEEIEIHTEGRFQKFVSDLHKLEHRNATFFER